MNRTRRLGIVTLTMIIAIIVITLALTSHTAQAQNPHNRQAVHCGVIISGHLDNTDKVVPDPAYPCFTPVTHKPITYLHWESDGIHPSKSVRVPAHWTLSFVCDGGSPENILYINGRAILTMLCDNQWHSRMFARGGDVQLFVTRGGVTVDITA